MNSVIGIVSCGLDGGRQFVTDTYIRAIETAGGIPLVIPCCQEACYPAFTRLCRGFLFCGGDDVSPLLFGEEPLTGQGGTDWNTDWFHLSFMRHVLETGLPVLGICRGMQILNLALGGTIWQDLSLRPGPTLQHMQVSVSRSDPSHQITLSNNSMLYDICGNSCDVNSFHHQCVKKLGKGLRITATTSDGVVEAIEADRPAFTAGVQWHPECMPEKKEMLELFRFFVHAT